METCSASPQTRQATADLFGWVDFPPDTYPHSPGFKTSGPSQDTAAAIAPIVKGLRAKVLSVFTANSPQAFTADQVASLMQRTPFSIRPRVSELARLGMIEKVDHRGKNESGMTAARWKAAAHD